MEELYIRLLGDFSVTCAHEPARLLDAPRLQALLAYLVLHRDAAQPRQHLAFLLWPDSREAQARTNLRQLLHSLKQALPQANRLVQTNAKTVQWTGAAPFRLDVAEFEAALAQADAAEQTEDPRALRAALEHAATIYQSDLLPSCYDDWILPERERLRQAFIAALERLTQLLESQGELRAAISYAQRLLRHDPLREETYCTLMRLYANCGDRAGALRVYHTCVTVLEGELAVKPSAATREVYEQVLRVDVQARPELPPQPSNTNLPVPLTSFVGRDAEMAEVAHLLQTTRLLTLTGPGGCGKTRLALETCTNLLDQYADGVWWVELAALSDAALVPQAVAATLGIREPSDGTLLETLTEYLRARQLLLLLDNCEHLVDACARLAEQLLSACPSLKILATSREVLSVGGETSWLVPSLALPKGRTPASVEEWMRSEATRLFVERAATVLPTFRLTAANAPLVAQICRRLDGMPLAIELAAARIKVLHVEQIAARLDDLFRLLTAGRRTALPRHQTLRAAVDWSHELLSEPEQMLFRRLSVFAGGFTLDAAEEVTKDEGGRMKDEMDSLHPSPFGLQPSNVLDLLTRLIDKSLVAVTQDGGATARYRVLETIRHYAREKLTNSGEGEGVRDRHLAYFVHLAEQAEPKLETAEQLPWLNRLEAELDNIRAALDWSVRGAQTDMGLRLATALDYFWWMRGYQAEGIGHLQKLLDCPDGAAHLLGRARALNVLSHLHGALGSVEPMTVTAREALQIAQNLADRPTAAQALHRLAVACQVPGKHAEANALFEQALAIRRALGDRRGAALSLQALGFTALVTSEYARAQALFAESGASWREIGNISQLAWSLRHEGFALLHQHEYQAARDRFGESLMINVEMGDQEGLAACLAAYAALAVARHEYSRAARLFGAVEALLESIRTKLLPYDFHQFRSNVATVRAHLDETALGARWAEGRALAQEHTITDAMSLGNEL